MTQTVATSNSHLEELFKNFEKLYPEPESELDFRNEYELVIAVALSAQCTDRRVNLVTAKLFPKYPTFEKLARARVSTIEKIIGSVNYYRTKAKNISELARIVVSDYDGELPKSFEQLVELPGVGRKTANVVLGELGITPALPVDTHVFRVSKRLGLASGKNTLIVGQELRELLPSDKWRPMHHWLILHGRRVCFARNPKCSECQVRELCPRVNVEGQGG